MIQLRLLFTVSFFSSLFLVHAQSENLVTFEELSFDSDFEKNIFTRLNSGSTEFFKGFLAISDADSSKVSQWKRGYDLRIERFKEEKRPKKNAKYVGKIYEFVHDEFLRKYENLAYFDQIFQNGVYNCVSACALYGLVFEDLGVPFVIKETPTHVYIIAYPDTEQIGIETTDPIGGFRTFSPGYKEAFINDLIRLKLMDMSEMSGGVNAVFNKYYFTNKELGLKELIGIQYYNRGISAMNDDQYAQAFSDFQKAYFFHPSEQVTNVLQAAGIFTISKLQYEHWDDVEMLTFLTKVDDPNIGNDEILGEFSRMMNKQLLNKNDTQFVHKAYVTMSGHISDSLLQDEIDYYYNYERGRMLFNRGNYKLAIPFITKAYKVKPNNFDVENLMVSTVNNALVANTYESEEYIALIDGLYDTFPNLTSNAHLGSLRMSIYLEAMTDAYLDKDVSTAEQYQRKFEEAVDQHNYRYQDFAVGKAYAQGITYYFRKGWYKSARALLNSGLKYAPDNSELKMRKYWLDRAQN